MNLKKTIITSVALIAIVAALLGVYKWQQSNISKPQRQGQEIR